MLKENVNNRGFARRRTHLYAQEFAPPLISFCMARYGEKQQKALELLIYFAARFEILTKCVF